jgi:excisionase family DNA binding protein
VIVPQSGEAVTLIPRQHAAESALLDYEELATWLKDSVRHLRRLVQEDRIPYLKVGHFVRFDPDEIGRWLDHNRHGHGRDH